MKALIFILMTCLLINPALADEGLEARFLRDLQQQILIQDSKNTLEWLQQLQQSLGQIRQTPEPQTLQQVQQQFRALVKSWKAMQVVYVAGALDESLLDHPRFIDYYHQGNESIPQLLQRALESEQPLSQALFKNSTRSIDALEYLLFADPGTSDILQDLHKNNFRRLDAALIAVKAITGWVEEIDELYREAADFSSSGKPMISRVVNGLIDSSYKLKNWRVGEAGGLVKKYQGKADARRLEYSWSDASLDAIIAILETHQRVLQRDNAVDLIDLGKARNVESEMLFLSKALQQALDAAKRIPRPMDEHIESKAYVELFESLTRLHNAYYFMLIDALGLDASIIDADGD